MSVAGVVCAGRVYCDLVFTGLQAPPVPGREVYADGLSLHAGGGAAITAYYLARLANHVELCSRLPAKPFDEIIRNELGSFVNLQQCRVAENADPQITVALTGKQDRSFVTHRAGNALSEDYKTAIEACIESRECGHLHIGELATLQDYPELLQLARSADWTVSLDCAWDSDAMQSPESLELIRQVDIFMPNEAEFNELLNAGVNEHTAPLTIIKRGEAGARAYTRDITVESIARKTTCVDTTGAGDAFNAGFLHAWLRGQSLPECLEYGNHCGAIAVGQAGGIGWPD